MFTERLNAVMERIGAKAPELAAIIGCDRSNIDRICKGVRVPKSGGGSAWRIVDALYCFADDRGKIAILAGTISCGETRSAGELKEGLMNWLYGYEGKNYTAAPKKTELHPYRSFGQKLNAVMELAELSNIRLSRLLNVDTSYISRFRNGFRSPASNPKMMDGICAAILKRLEEQGRLPRLATLMNAAPQTRFDEKELFRTFRGWLFDAADRDTTSLVTGMIDCIGSSPADITKPPLSFEQAVSGGVTDDTEKLYSGIDGLRRAVIRFLGNVILRKEKELYLYSDQNIDWMTGDPLFRAKWATLMIMCVAQGTMINIVHNIDRGLDEMVSAIKSWIPLYPSGMIRSYYSESERSERFSNTLFLCPGYACISGNNIVGAENESGAYVFETSPDMLEVYKRTYDSLLGISHRLANAYNTAELGRFGDIGSRGVTVLGTTLSLSSMPRSVFRSVIERAGTDAEVLRGAEKMFESRTDVLKEAMKNGFFHECVPLPQKEGLQCDGVAVDLPESRLFYGPSEYAGHVRNIIALSEDPNYRFYPLPEAPFSDAQIVLSEKAVAVSRLSAPYVTIIFEHPALCRAFADYAEKIKLRYRQDKSSVKELLEGYL